jgi:hypothetical protein
MTSRFKDNNDGTITDHQINIMWKKTDSFQDTKKWLNWLKCPDYVKIVNTAKFAGYDNWRLPNQPEAWSLFELTKKNYDKYGDEIYLDPVFERGSAGVTWTSDTKESAALVIQYEDGQQVWPSQYANLNMAVRLVRDII